MNAFKIDTFAVQIRVNGLKIPASIQNRNFNTPPRWNAMNNSFPQRIPGTEGLEPSEFGILSRLAPKPITR